MKCLALLISAHKLSFLHSDAFVNIRNFIKNAYRDRQIYDVQRQSFVALASSQGGWSVCVLVFGLGSLLGRVSLLLRALSEFAQNILWSGRVCK